MPEPHLTVVFPGNRPGILWQLRRLLRKFERDEPGASLTLSLLAVPTLDEMEDVVDRLDAAGRPCVGMGPMSPPEEEEHGTPLCQ